MPSKSKQPAAIPPTNSTLPAEGLVRLPLVLKVYPVSRSGWFAGVKSGRFPASVKIGPRAVAWRVEDIRALIAKA